MNAEREVESIVRSWLEDGVTALPDRVLDDVLDVLPQTPQRRSWPPRRVSDMNTFAKLAIAAAAVVVVAVVGINLLPPSSEAGGGGPAVSPSPQQLPSPSPVAALPPDGPLAIGTYPGVLGGVPISFSIQTPGLSFDHGNAIGKGEYGQSDSLEIHFWSSSPENVYTDPCAHTPLSPPPSATAAGLAAAVAAIPGTDLITGPSSVDVGGRPAQHVAFTIREDIGCDPKEFYLWYDESTGGASGGWEWAGRLGATHRVWIIDVDGRPLWINAESFKGAGPEIEQEIQQIVDSVRILPAPGD
jgi:hypothetical protein